MSLKIRLISLNKEIVHLNHTIETIDKVIDTIDQEVKCLDDSITKINSEIDHSIESIKLTYQQTFDKYQRRSTSSFNNQHTQTEHARFESMYEELKQDGAPVVENVLWTIAKRLLCVFIS